MSLGFAKMNIWNAFCHDKEKMGRLLAFLTDFFHVNKWTKKTISKYFLHPLIIQKKEDSKQYFNWWNWVHVYSMICSNYYPSYYKCPVINVNWLVIYFMLKYELTTCFLRGCSQITSFQNLPIWFFKLWLNMMLYT